MKNLKHILVLIIFFVFGNSFLEAQNANPIMWRISSDSSIVFIIGSIHAGRDDFYPLPNKIYKALDSSNIFVTEIDLNPENLTGIMTSAVIPEGEPTLDTYMSKETYDSLVSDMSNIGIPEYALMQFQPWFAALMYMTLGTAEAGLDVSLGVDMHLKTIADSLKKENDYLETLDDQINAIKGSITNTSEYFKYLISSNDSTNAGDAVSKMCDAWYKGDADALNELINEDKSNINTKTLEYLLINRNIKMSQKIEMFLNKKGIYFVAAGAAHIVGKKSIIDLLKNTKKYNIFKY